MIEQWVVFLRTMEAWGADKARVLEVLRHAEQNLPGLEERTQYVREALAAMVPGPEQLENAIAGLARDWATKSATKDPDAWGGA